MNENELIEKIYHDSLKHIRAGKTPTKCYVSKNTFEKIREEVRNRTRRHYCNCPGHPYTYIPEGAHIVVNSVGGPIVIIQISDSMAVLEAE